MNLSEAPKMDGARGVKMSDERWILVRKNGSGPRGESLFDAEACSSLWIIQVSVDTQARSVEG